MEKYKSKFEEGGNLSSKKIKVQVQKKIDKLQVALDNQETILNFIEMMENNFDDNDIIQLRREFGYKDGMTLESYKLKSFYYPLSGGLCTAVFETTYYEYEIGDYKTYMQYITVKENTDLEWSD